MINDEDSILSKANRDLYANDDVTNTQPLEKRSFLHEKKIVTPDSWKESFLAPSRVVRPKTPTTSWFKKMFLGALGFLVLAIALAAFSLLQGVNSISSRNVTITLTTRSFVDGGESFPVAVSIVNRNRVGLELATLTLEYPEGNAQNPDAVARITREIGSMRSGETKQESFDMSLFGEEGSTRVINASLEFRVAGSNVIYTSNGSTDLVIRSSPVLLTADIPDAITPNQEVPLKFTITGNGTAILPETALVLKYPDGFTFIRSDVPPTVDNQIWFLGDLPPGVNRTITVTGTFSGGVNELKTLQASVGMQDPRNERLLSTVYNTVSEVIPLTNTFLGITIEAAGQHGSQVSISASSQSSITIHWTNTLTVPITNAEVRVKLSGSAYDAGRIQQGSGFFDTNTNTITWSRQQVPDFASIAPGKSGDLSFSVTPRPSVSGTNPFIEVAVDASGFDGSGARLNAERIDVKKLILNSDLNLIAQTLYSSGLLQNTGPIPPRSGQETTYTIDWQITNSRNRITNASVSTILPLGVTWKNVVVPQNEQGNVSYNSVTREVLWNVGDIGTNSMGSSPKEVSFKIAITPSGNQVGKIPELTGDSILHGHDEFTNNDITVNRRALTTQLYNDGSNTGTNGQVVN